MKSKRISHNSLIVLLFTLIISSSAIQAANVVTDPSFEGGLKFWKMPDSTASIVNSPTRTGSNSLKMVNTGNGVDSKSHTAGQRSISGIEAGREYTYKVWVSGKNLKGIGGGGKPLAVVGWRDAAGKVVRTGEGKLKESYLWAPYGSYGFRSMTMNLQAPSNAKFLDINFRTWWGTTSGTSFWDDVSLVSRDFSKRGKLVGTYQAENASSMSGGVVHKSHLDYTGTGYYDVDTNGAHLEWNNVVGGGKRNLSFRFSWEGNEQKLELFVNGVSQGARKPVPTGRRGVWASDIWNVNLPSGKNRIRLKISTKGGYNSQPMFDKLDVFDPGQSGGDLDPVPGNNAPVIASISNQTITEGDALIVPVSAKDADGPSPLTLTQTNNLPGKPNVLKDFGGGIGEVYWPSSVGDASGSPYSITINATDGKGAKSSRTFRVTVNSVGGGGSGGKLSGKPTAAPSQVNLTTEGASDWVHWGLNSSSDVDRKVTGGTQISDLNPVGGAAMPRGTNGLTVYSWKDGMPTSSTSNTKSGLRVYDLNKGFEFTVPADTNMRTLRVYVGAKYVNGRFEATLSDGSAPKYVTNITQPSGITSKAITLNYQAASSGALLTVRYVLDNKPGARGWISLESATLNGAAGGPGGPGGSGDGDLSGNNAAGPSNVNLTNVGSSDWIHWGLNAAADVNRKANGGSRISDFTSVGGGSAPRGTNAATVYSWKDGSPMGSVSNTRAGVRAYKVGKGFEFSVPAGTAPKTLKIYLGAKNVGGTLKATLSDGSAPVYSTKVEQLSGVTSRVITLKFQAASAGEKLTVRYVLESKPGSTGWISLESAALQ